MSFIFYIVVALAAGGALLGLVSQLPPIPSEVIAVLQTAMGWASSPTNLVPVDTIFRIVGLIILIETILFGVKIVGWIWNRLTASSGGSANDGA